MKTTNKYSHIIWDWNGTLLNDTKWCMEVKNKMLSKRNLKTFNSLSEYRQVFCFPIKDYYIKIGFDFTKEPFEDLAIEFINLYHYNNTGNCQLNRNSELVLETIKQKGITQIILSASEINNLLKQVNQFKIIKYFQEILGISDIYAKSKIDIGLDYVKRNKVEKGLLIGDTIHDYEVAMALGIDCILIAQGHQSKERLLACGVPVLDNLEQIMEYIEQ